MTEWTCPIVIMMLAITNLLLGLLYRLLKNQKGKATDGDST